MDHSHHYMDAGGMDMHKPMEAMCNMNMLFTWNTENLCIVFRSWHVRSNIGLVVSLLLVVALSAGYEALRAAVRMYEIRLARQTETVPLRHPQDLETENTPILRAGQVRTVLSKQGHLVKSILYGLQNFYAFMIMLVFMTYNGWVMVAVSLGAFLGYYFFGVSTDATKETACH